VTVRHAGSDTVRDEREPDELALLREKVLQLQTALVSRLVIEQAKGMLAERHGLAIEEAFLVLRRVARSARRTIREVAAEVVRRDRPIDDAAISEAVAQLALGSEATQRDQALREEARNVVVGQQ
jgi:hypothetical protein